MSVKRHLENIIRMNPDLVIPQAEVELGEDAGAVEFIKELLHHWEGELILDGAFVEDAVVDAEAPRRGPPS
jgi:hypothetical protein